MGVFSFECAKCGFPITHGRQSGVNRDVWNQAILITPNDQTLKGEYDGYGRIGIHDVFAQVVQGVLDSDELPGVLPKDSEVRDLFFNRDLTEHFDDLPEERTVSEDEVRHTSDYNRPLISIVRADLYEGESWKELEPSPDHPGQGMPGRFEKYLMAEYEKDPEAFDWNRIPEGVSVRALNNLYEVIHRTTNRNPGDAARYLEENLEDLQDPDIRSDLEDYVPGYQDVPEAIEDWVDSIPPSDSTAGPAEPSI